MVIKILVVEDNELNADMLSQRLTRKGYEIIFAVDGEEAIQVAKKSKPQLILMDMGLPILDGWEATRRLKADPETKHIPIIALTAHSMADDREQALNVGCEEYETKPVNFTRLIDKIEKLVGKI
jgi:two-component system, cell cycle response regulator DivK